ncbi:MAG: type IV pilus twitching motility protein PilT [Methylacidiphilales bacterium]|nr:type IV pilus twitching motility protein PilT [Candidatus Methylacidiphilales bacterium]MDW8349765.1 type IV pilus twitching motility protein PilT [Verrucomicrobiae bacterium]
MQASVKPDVVLNLAQNQGWISAEQRTAIETILMHTPQVSVLSLLQEQQLITEAELKALQEMLSSSKESVSQSAAEKKTTGDQPETTKTLISTPVGLFSGVVDFLRYAQSIGASDLHLGVSIPPTVRLHGHLMPMIAGADPLRSDQTESLIRSFLSPNQWQKLLQDKTLEFSYEVPEIKGRFRVSIVRQRRGFDAVFRIINTQVRTMDELGLPEHLKTLTDYHNGLILVTGPSGCGKSTTMAALVEQINLSRRDHIITLEDPIEIVFEPKGCHITQREVHSHTESFAKALRAALREDPDVIMVGEMRDLETISLAITAAETGHLVIGTLHTSTAARTLDRVLDVFPPDQQYQIRQMVSESLRGIICQQLIPRADGQGRVLALEILINVPAVASLVRDAKTFMLPGVMQTGKRQGMQLMDDALLNLLRQGLITPEEAFDRAEQKHLFNAYLS